MPPRGIVIQITGDGASAAKALELVDQHLRETASSAKESASVISGAMEEIKRRIEVVALDMVLYEAIGKMKEMVDQTLDFGEAIQKAHEKTGLAVETLSTLHYAAAITGTEFDGLTKAVAKMGASIGNAADGNDKKASAFLKGLGLDAKELASRSDGAEVAFKRVAQAIAATENPVRRLELANGLLKKGGQDMIPMLLEIGNNWDKFKQKAQDTGFFLTGEQAAALEATNQRLADMKRHILGASLAFTEGMTPGLTQMLDVIAGGKSTMDVMTVWGNTVIRTLAAVAAGFYGLASAAEVGFGTIEALTPGLGDAARKDLAAAKDLADQAAKFRDIAVNGPAAGPTTPFMPPLHPGGKAFEGTTGTGKSKSTNAITDAAVALAQANATAEAAAQKSADELLLAQMESDHKLFLTSDANYYREKLLLQKDALDAEEGGLRQRITELQALQAKQHGDKKLTRDKSGNSAEEEKTATEIVRLNQQINALEEKRATLDVNAKLAAEERADAVHLASLKAAAQMEEHTDSGISARLALMQREQQLAMQKTTAEGGDVKTLAALQQQEQELLKIDEIEREINRTKEAGALLVAAQKDRETKDPTQRKAATKEINALNQQTAATLKDLVAQYDALAATLGGDFIEKARALHAQLDTLNRPDKKDNAQFTKTLGDGITHMAEQIGSASLSGKNSFHQMVQSMEKDLIELAIKLAAQKWLTPFLNGLGSGGGSSPGAPDISPGNFPGFASGGDPTGPSIVGENGPELFFPKGPGTVMPNEALSELSKTGGGGMPNMTMNVTNASSQPVTARQTGSSFDADTRSYMTHVILEDLQQGGPISSALRPGG